MSSTRKPNTHLFDRQFGAFANNAAMADLSTLAGYPLKSAPVVDLINTTAGNLTVTLTARDKVPANLDAGLAATPGDTFVVVVPAGETYTPKCEVKTLVGGVVGMAVVAYWHDGTSGDNK